MLRCSVGGLCWWRTSCSLDEKRVKSHRETQAPRQQLDISFRLPSTEPRGAQLRRLYAQPEKHSVRRLCVTTMSAATASIADVSRTDLTDKNDWNKSGNSKAQCTPVPLPEVGTQKIIQGNGTNVGTVISLQCPVKHKLVGSEMRCVMGPNSTYWAGAPYCRSLSSNEFGFRVAVMASIVSSGIILFMSVAFITCCLLDCIKEEEKTKEENDSDPWQWEEQAQNQENNTSRYSHKGRNNNNNNTQENLLSPWDTANPALCDSIRSCRCHQHYAYGPACTNYGPTPPPAALPGHDYNQPLLPQMPEPDPPQYPGPPLSSCQSTSLVQISAAGSGLVWQYEGQQSSLSGANPLTTDEAPGRNINSNRNIYPKDLSIRIISV